MTAIVPYITEIWDGNPGPVKGSTSFGYYDNDTEFQIDAPKFAKWAARQMGYPNVDVELASGSFYDAYESATIEYSSMVNQHVIRENILSLQGSPTNVNMTHKLVRHSLGSIIRMAQAYGAEVGLGDNMPWHTSSIAIKDGQQMYDLNKLIRDIQEPGKQIEIQKVYHNSPPASTFMGDPYYGGYIADVMASFGFEKMSPPVQYLLTPLYQDVLRMQSIELNRQIRRSQYSFELNNNRLRIFPVPTSDTTLWMEYTVTNDRNKPTYTPYSTQTTQSTWVSRVYNGPLFGSISNPMSGVFNGYYTGSFTNVFVSASVSGSTSTASFVDYTTGNVVTYHGAIDAELHGWYDGQFYGSVTGNVSGSLIGTAYSSFNGSIWDYSSSVVYAAVDEVSDISNAPYDLMSYSKINSVGKRWIMRFALVLAKGVLGMVRSKYQSIPLPEGDLQLDGDTLRQESATEKESLLTELKETLEAMNKSSLMEVQRTEMEVIGQVQNKIPNKIYIG